MDASSAATHGRGRPKKRKATKDAAAAAAASDKKRRTTRASRQPVLPPSIELNTTHAALNNFDAPTVGKILLSDNPDQVASALNALLRASSDVDVNYCLGPGGETILLALVKLFDEAIGWDVVCNIHDNGDDSNCNDNLEPTVASWDSISLSGMHQRWRTFCRNKLASPLASSSDTRLLIEPETDTRVLDVIIAIFRNLSFVAQNLRFLYHTEGVLRVLTGAMYYRGFSAGGGGGGGAGDERSNDDAPSSPHNSNMCVHSIQTLINMAPIIDVTGRQLFIDRIFLESDAKEVLCTVPGQQIAPTDATGDASTGTDNVANSEERTAQYGMSSHLGFGGMYLAKQYDTKAESLDNIPNSVIRDLVGPHVRTTLAIFPALSAILDPNDTTSMTGWHRPSVQAVLEFLTALAEFPDNKGIFLCAPDAVLHRLTEMLFMPRLGPDSMDYVDPVSNTVSRIVALKLMGGYDATIDSDMRDRACELLIKLTDFSSGIKRRLGMARSISGMARRTYTDPSPTSLLETPMEWTHSILRSDEISSSRRMNVRLYDCLLSMVSSSSGKGDAGSLAIRLLANLALIPDNKIGLRYVERKLIYMAAKDPNMAKIACNGIFNRVK